MDTDCEPPNLIADVLRLVFGKLPAADRRPLALVSKDIRALDLDVGKRHFTEIIFAFQEEFVEIEACTPSGRFIFHPANEVAFDVSETEYLRLFFKNATFDLSGSYVSHSGDVRAMIAILDFIQGLVINFEDMPNFDYSEMLSKFVDLYAERSDLKEMSLNFMGFGRTNKSLTRRALQKITNLSYLNVITQKELLVGQSGFLLDGLTLSHLIMNSKESVFDISLAPRDLLEAFEIIVRSEMASAKSKMVVHGLNVVELCAVVEAWNEYKVEAEPNKLFIRDDLSKGLLTVKFNENSRTRVVLKFDVDGLDESDNDDDEMESDEDEEGSDDDQMDGDE